MGFIDKSCFIFVFHYIKFCLYFFFLWVQLLDYNFPAGRCYVLVLEPSIVPGTKKMHNKYLGKEMTEGRRGKEGERERGKEGRELEGQQNCMLRDYFRWSI